MNAITTKDITRFVITSALCFFIVTLCQFALAVFTHADFDPNWLMNVMMAMAGGLGEYIGIQINQKKTA